MGYCSSRRGGGLQLLGVRDGGSGSDGKEIIGSGGVGKGCVSGREDICGGGGSCNGCGDSRGDVSGGSSRYASRGLLSAFSHTRLER